MVSPPAGRPRAVAALARGRFCSRTRRRNISPRGEKDQGNVASATWRLQDCDVSSSTADSGPQEHDAPTTRATREPHEELQIKTRMTCATSGEGWVGIVRVTAENSMHYAVSTSFMSIGGDQRETSSAFCTPLDLNIGTLKERDRVGAANLSIPNKIRNTSIAAADDATASRIPGSEVRPKETRTSI
ncbi:hypothetical protein BHM03_00061424 [Ensete ventricosum]|nr:hypothetical protein BHM03_00061424 [Ensete ventricosum]